MTAERTLEVIVVGDAVIDEYRFMMTEDPSERLAAPGKMHWELNTQWEACIVPGGAHLLRDLIESRASSAEMPADLERQVRLRSYAELRKVARSSRNDGISDLVWRVSQFRGYGRVRNLKPFPHTLPAGSSGTRPILVVADAGNDFRHDDRIAKRTAGMLGNGAIVLHKMLVPFEQAPLWSSLWQTAGSLPDSTYITVVNADDLRRAGLAISKRASWQRTLDDLAGLVSRALESGASDPLLARLFGIQLGSPADGQPRSEFLIIRMDCDAAAYVSVNGSRGDRKIGLWCAPGASEGDWDDAHPGQMVGKMSCFTAQLTLDLSTPPDRTIDETRIAELTQRALVASRLFTASSFDFRENSKRRRALLRIPSSKSVTSALALGDHTLLNLRSGEGVTSRTGEIASAYLSKGKRALDGLPFATFGNLLCVDQSEIEGFRMIADLLKRHFDDTRRDKPISIGVFGAPGGGKSFRIKEVAKSVAGKDVVILEFNVAQFGDNSLMLAMHEIRDAVLEGKRPICLFDEYDSGDLKYLASFLAPMQDGRFEDEGMIRPVGPAVFVFIGGVFANHAEMSESIRSSENGKGGSGKPDYKKLKLPDFASRLSGYVEVSGIDMPTGPDSRNVMLRRAILLRSILIRSMQNLFVPPDDELSIDPGLAWAFLNVPAYRHGARSMEAIVRMSGIDRSSNHYPVSALPIDNQLELHVEAAKFRELITSGPGADRAAAGDR